MLWRIRILAFYTLISLIITSFFIIICPTVKIFSISYHWRYKFSIILSNIFIYLMWIICGIKFKVTGLEKLPTDGKPYLVLSNHQSFWENFFMQLIIPEHSWVIKKELFNIPFFGWCLRLLKPIAVDRNDSNSITQILYEGANKINNGLSIIIFPESTRVKVDHEVKFKPSAAKLALETKTSIVLLAHNAGLIWPKGFWFKSSGTIKISIIEYMSTEHVTQFKEARELTDYIQNKINKEKNLLREIGV
ncbi:MAG: 1-acyl-sn-glycerol-3-phosphate acyltransferase [Rickettsiales bacterium]|nr:MAG: 1-acyl-sn-glycerol-3-phosphate acyltransferase [Rickettsiales bacterium]